MSRTGSQIILIITRYSILTIGKDIKLGMDMDSSDIEEEVWRTAIGPVYTGSCLILPYPAPAKMFSYFRPKFYLSIFTVLTGVLCTYIHVLLYP